MDFSFEDKFCKHFVSLRKSSEVFVNFNIDQCLPKMTDKIYISLYYDEKLDVEKEKRYINLPESVNSANEVGKSPAKLQHIFLILTMVAYFSINNFCTQLASNVSDRPTRLLYTGILLMTNRPQISMEKIVLSLFRSFLSLTMLFATYLSL